MVKYAAQAVAQRAVEARLVPLPPATVDAARSVLLDWCGVTIAGSATPLVQKLRAAVIHPGQSAGPSLLAGFGGSTDAATAALINGTAAHTLELDDIYAPGLYHPSAPVVAASLAVAQHADVSGERLVRGIVVGYEVGNRVAQTLGAPHYEFWHATGTAGSVAAAAAVAEILQLDAAPFAHALALSATLGAGLQQTFRTDSMGKPLHSGHAAYVGVLAGLLASTGFTGALDVFDGEVGMGICMSDSPSWASIGEPFGPDYLITLTTTKPYSCCGHTFAAIDAVKELYERGLRPEDAQQIEVETYAAALSVAGNPAPVTAFEAQFSIPFVVACALRDGRLDTDVFRDSNLQDPHIGVLMAATTMRSDREFTEAFPARRGARVRIVDRSGRPHAATVPDRWGSPGNPLTSDQRNAKFLALVDGVLGSERAARLREQVRSIHTADTVTSLALAP